MTTQMTIQAVADRCSKYSGWNLQVAVGPESAEFVDPNDRTNDHASRLVLTLAGPRGCEYLHEAYGRMWHWGITQQEKRVILLAIQEARRKANPEVEASIDAYEAWWQEVKAR